MSISESGLKVSIITPCLNGAKHLERTIQSVIHQTYGNIEYIIIDGGSTDDTLKIVRKYAGHIAYWVSEPDKGIYDAINKGIDLSSGELIGVLSSNDYYDKEAVGWVIEAYKQRREAGIFFGDAVGIKQCLRQKRKGRVELGQFRPFRSSLEIAHSATFIHKEVHQRWRYDAKFKIGADYDLLWKAYNAGIKFHYLDKILTYLSLPGASGHYRCLLENYAIRKKYHKLRALYLLLKETFVYFIRNIQGWY
ncbi:MAG: glycosyltransferase family 2 protein [Candidatus Omnitrophota bacterium]